MKQLIFLFLFFSLGLNIFAQQTDTIFVEIGNFKILTVLDKPNADLNLPLVIIIAGSGPTDHNGNSGLTKNNSLLLLSKSLVASGFATLRFDKRGIGKSTLKNFKEEELTLDVFVEDVVKIISHSKSLGYRNIYILGHSEGALIGLLAAIKTDIKAYISLCGPGNSADLILKKQLKKQISQEYYEKSVKILDSLSAGYQVNETPVLLNALFRKSVQPYLISWFKYNPAEIIKSLKSPLLIIQGDKDLQVDMEEGQILGEAIGFENLITIKNMNHVLKIIGDQKNENLSSYYKPDLPISEDLIYEISKFIKQTKQ